MIPVSCGESRCGSETPGAPGAVAIAEPAGSACPSVGLTTARPRISPYALKRIAGQGECAPKRMPRPENTPAGGAIDVCSVVPPLRFGRYWRHVPYGNRAVGTCRAGDIHRAGHSRRVFVLAHCRPLIDASPAAGGRERVPYRGVLPGMPHNPIGPAGGPDGTASHRRDRAGGQPPALHRLRHAPGRACPDGGCGRLRTRPAGGVARHGGARRAAVVRAPQGHAAGATVTPSRRAVPAAMRELPIAHRHSPTDPASSPCGPRRTASPTCGRTGEGTKRPPHAGRA